MLEEISFCFFLFLSHPSRESLRQGRGGCCCRSQHLDIVYQSILWLVWISLPVGLFFRVGFRAVMTHRKTRKGTINTVFYTDGSSSSSFFLSKGKWFISEIWFVSRDIMTMTVKLQATRKIMNSLRFFLLRRMWCYNDQSDNLVSIAIFFRALLFLPSSSIFSLTV